MESKQIEYNFLSDSKDKEIKFLQDEILKLNELSDLIKKDRMKDQKLMNDYESTINVLNQKLQESANKSPDSLATKDQNASKIEVKYFIIEFILTIEKNCTCENNGQSYY